MGFLANEHAPLITEVILTLMMNLAFALLINYFLILFWIFSRRHATTQLTNQQARNRLSKVSIFGQTKHASMYEGFYLWTSTQESTKKDSIYGQARKKALKRILSMDKQARKH